MRTSHPKDADVVEVLANDVLKTGWLLCFDEFQVENNLKTFTFHATMISRSFLPFAVNDCTE